MRRRTTPTPLTLDDFDLAEQLDFLSGWTPQIGRDRDRGSRWETWGAYLRDFGIIRTALYARYRTGPRADFPAPFAERARCFAEAHGLDALQAADYSMIRNYETEARS